MKLRHLPHIFSKVLELPFLSDVYVAVQEGPTAFRFVVPTDDFDADVAARAVEIYLGVLKVVIRDGGENFEEEMELDRRRFMLPNSKRPRLACAEYVDGRLVVTVPKGIGEEEDERDEFRIGRLVMYSNNKKRMVVGFSN